jgi:thioesterase domain-containing protein
MAAIWSEVLGVQPIGIHDDFFELGGHSLLAVRMLAEVARVRGRQVPLTWLFESSTIEGLVARLLSELHATEEPPLIVLQGDTPGTPLAFVHGDGHGGGWYCRRLAPLVAPDAPFYVLPTLGEVAEEQTWRIEQMAARHVAELRKVRPHGPYRLGGFCVGGLIAFEMARQLRAAGETVERVIAIDSAATNARLGFVKPLLAFVPGKDASVRLARRAALMKRLRRYYTRRRQVKYLETAQQIAWVRNNIVRRWNRVRTYVGQARAPRATPPPVTTQRLSGNYALNTVGDRVMDVQERAGLVYIPGRYGGPVDLIYAQKKNAGPRRDPTRDFWRVAETVHVHTLVAQHITLITSDLPKLAAVIRTILERESP